MEPGNRGGVAIVLVVYLSSFQKEYLSQHTEYSIC